MWKELFFQQTMLGQLDILMQKKEVWTFTICQREKLMQNGLET